MLLNKDFFTGYNAVVTLRPALPTLGNKLLVLKANKIKEIISDLCFQDKVLLSLDEIILVQLR